MSVCQHSVGEGAGSGDSQGVNTPWTLTSAQKGAQNKTNHQNTPRDGAAQERVMRKHYIGGQETRDWRHDTHQEQQGTGIRSIPAGRGRGLRLSKMVHRDQVNFITEHRGLARDVF